MRGIDIRPPVYQLWMVMYSEGGFGEIDSETVIGTFFDWELAVTAKNTASVMLDKLYRNEYTMEIRLVDENDTR